MGNAPTQRQVVWHADRGFHPRQQRQHPRTGVATGPMTEEYGCRRVVTGSHKSPAYDRHEDGVFVGAVQTIGGDVDNTGVVPMNQGEKVKLT